VSSALHRPSTRAHDRAQRAFASTLRAFACALIAFAFCSAPAHAQQSRAPELVHLVVLHTNDVHGQLLPTQSFASAAAVEPGSVAASAAPRALPARGGMLHLAARAARERAQAEASGAGVLFVDSGDWFQGTPEGQHEGGTPFARALALAGYDALCVGNHEFDLGLAALERLLERARPPAVLANAARAGGAGLSGGIRPWRIVERAGLRIALVGLVTTATPELTHRDARALEFREPARALGGALVELLGQADLVIPLTHLGLEEDRRLADAYPGLPLIVGGHSHSVLPEGEQRGSTLIVQAGSKAAYLGRVDLWYERGERRVSRSQARLIELTPADAEALAPNEQALGALVSADFAAHCAKLARDARARMDEVLTQAEAPLLRSRGFASGAAANLVCEAMLVGAKTDVALMNRGGLRADLPAGALTRRHLFELLPFADSLVVLELSGAQLEQVLSSALEGQTRSGIDVAGVELELELTGAGRAKLRAVRIGGRPLARERVYRVALPEFVATGGDRFFAESSELRWTSERHELRALVEAVVKRNARLEPDTRNRFRVADGGAQ